MTKPTPTPLELKCMDIASEIREMINDTHAEDDLARLLHIFAQDILQSMRSWHE